VFHTPPPAAELPARLEAMCDFANSKTPDTFIHPVVRGIFLHFWLAYDHPFVDGNGRTARALFYIPASCTASPVTALVMPWFIRPPERI
jgi:Fic family protein